MFRVEEEQLSSSAGLAKNLNKQLEKKRRLEEEALQKVAFLLHEAWTSILCFRLGFKLSRSRVTRKACSGCWGSPRGRSLLCWSRVRPRQVSLVTSAQVTVLLVVDITLWQAVLGCLGVCERRILERIVVSYFWPDYNVCILGMSVLHTAEKNKPRLWIIYVYIKFNLANFIKQMVNISRKCFLK